MFFFINFTCRSIWQGIIWNNVKVFACRLIFTLLNGFRNVEIINKNAIRTIFY